MELWFLLAIVTSVFWGVGGIFAKISTPKLGVARVALLIATVEGVAYAGAYLVTREEAPMSLGDAVLTALSCLAGISGYLCFFESIMQGQVAIAGTISAAFPAPAVVGALVFLSETMTGVQAIGVALVIGGVIALSHESDPGAPHAMSRHSLIFALLAFGLWGVWSITSKVAVDAVGEANVFGFYALASVTAPLLYWSVRRLGPESRSIERPRRLLWVVGALALAINVCGTFAFTYALGLGTASLVVPIASSYPLVTIVLAIVLLKEKVDRLQAVALSCVVSGLVFIGMTL